MEQGSANLASDRQLSLNLIRVLPSRKTRKGPWSLAPDRLRIRNVGQLGALFHGSPLPQAFSTLTWAALGQGGPWQSTQLAKEIEYQENSWVRGWVAEMCGSRQEKLRNLAISLLTQKRPCHPHLVMA